MNIIECVYLVGELPQRPAILLFDESEEYIFEGLRHRYHSISLWHRWHTLKEDISHNLVDSDWDKGLHQPAITESHAWLDLITELYPRSGNSILRSFGSPDALWFALYVFESEMLLTEYGLDGLGNKPKPISKLKEIAELTKFIDVLSGSQLPVGTTPINEKPSMYGLLSEEILNEACKFSQELPNEFDKYFRLFLKRWKKSLNLVRNDKSIQIPWVDPTTNELKLSRKHQKLPKPL